MMTCEQWEKRDGAFKTLWKFKLQAIFTMMCFRALTILIMMTLKVRSHTRAKTTIAKLFQVSS